MELGLTGQRVWVTGASRGLGRAIAEGFVEAGAQVAVTARSADRLAGDGLWAMPGSVADIADVTRIADEIERVWGGLDVLVNCAGISPSMTASDKLEPDEWRQVLDVNLSGTFWCSQAASRLMHGPASIVNISSVHGAAGMPRLAAYSASKGAVDALTRTLGLEWADRGIRVNAVCPGYFETDMTEGLRGHDRWRTHLLDRVPLGRFGLSGDLVPLVLFLASPLSAYVTGTSVAVDGGWTAQ